MTDPARTIRRRGPRPLGLHLTAAAMLYASSNAALPFWNAGSTLSLAKPQTPPGARPGRRAGSAGKAAGVRESLAGAVEREARRRLDRFLTGVERYRTHPYRRAVPDVPVIWETGGSRLLQYAPPSTTGTPVLLVPSLVNRAYILDLTEQHSFARWLGAQGLRPYLLDWGLPGVEEADFTLTDYVAGRLESAFETVHARVGGGVAVLGYCMGGLLALALAVRRQADVGALALLATPWDFHAGSGTQGRALATLVRQLDPLLALTGNLPVDVLQALFAALDPFLAVRKFQAFAAMAEDAPAALRFVALEDWLNDGVPLAAPVARECAAGWYGRNTPASGRWRIAGHAVDPRAWTGPSCVIVPANDRIVPPASAEALAQVLPRARVHRPATGHIGMMASPRAVAPVWEPLAAWLRTPD